MPPRNSLHLSEQIAIAEQTRGSNPLHAFRRQCRLLGREASGLAMESHPDLQALGRCMGDHLLALTHEAGMAEELWSDLSRSELCQRLASQCKVAAKTLAEDAMAMASPAAIRAQEISGHFLALIPCILADHEREGTSSLTMTCKLKKVC